MLLSLSLNEMILIFITITIAYIIFSMAGFGSALIAGPILAHFMPILQIVPLLALLDMFAALTNIAKDRRKADTSELKRLVPLMVMGSLVGVAILMNTESDFLLLALGVFVMIYALYSLSGFRPQQKFVSMAAIPFGLIGGIFSALFGTGGFIYAIYLSGRIKQKEYFRVTQITLIGLSTLTRVVFFAIAGIYMDVSLLIIFLILTPAVLCGIFVGRRITLRLTHEQFIRIINIAILFCGAFLLIRYFSH